MMELKIEEYRNAKNMDEANSILNDIYKMNFNKIYSPYYNLYQTIQETLYIHL